MYTALSDTSKTIKEFLDYCLKPPKGFPDGNYRVLLENPEEMKNTKGLSVWLYRVERDDHTLNMPPKKVNTSHIERIPLPFRLHYLVTPLVKGTTETEQTILGRVLQCLHDNPVIRGTGSALVELNLRLEPLSLEEITRVWDALGRSYQLSVSYEVSVVYIESGKQPEEISPVEVLMPEYGVIVSSENIMGT
jgi:hypothetical protein